jgi:hypothetical protein
MRADGLAGEVAGPARIGEAPQLRRDEQRLTPLLQEAADQGLAPSQPVDVRRVQEVAPRLRRRAPTSPQSAPPNCQHPSPISETALPV